MAKRLYMTSADYVAIAISPALIMALVGSLVFFLIEVMYAGQYQARLNYAFALFVFAAVLIARISIEMGSERAALFALPLGIVMFLFLLRFVEHPSAFSHVINLALLGLVWWCAHRLTWDSTVIDDDEDASGEGLMQRIGVDGPERPAPGDGTRDSVLAGTKENELLHSDEAAGPPRSRLWKRLIPARSGPHTPGIWVFYFSLAALPLFGIGQHWIPVAEVGRRRYVFLLLLVYVAAALALLVTTSFLNLRRYLRQRRIEMPLPIAGTWVGVGAALIVLVMMLAALIPRPGAEIALSRVPWQAGSPDDHTASRTSVHRDGGEQQGEQESPQAGETVAEEGRPGNQQQNAEQSESGEPSSSGGEANAKNSDRDSQAADGEMNGEPGGKNDDDSKNAAEGDGDSSGQSGESSDGQNESPTKIEKIEKPREQTTDNQPAEPQSPPPTSPAQTLLPRFGGLAGVLKILLYIVAALLAAFFVWRYRHQLLQAFADFLRQLRELFGGARTTRQPDEAAIPATKARRRSFVEFRDPFVTGQHGSLPPEELVRYTFAAFEAWANDRGSPRSPDCTPQELIGLAVEPQTPMYNEASRLIRLYSQAAYASQRIPREAANELRELWQMMRTMSSLSDITPR